MGLNHRSDNIIVFQQMILSRFYDLHWIAAILKTSLLSISVDTAARSSIRGWVFLQFLKRHKLICYTPELGYMRGKFKSPNCSSSLYKEMSLTFFHF